MSDPTLAQRIGDFAVHCTESPLPPAVTASVRQRILDILGIAIAATPLDTSAAIRTVVSTRGGATEATAIGLPIRLPTASAALNNGTLAHSLDYDDTHLPSILHPSAAVIPAALAVGQATDASGPAVMNAIAAGLEICVRLGMVGYDRTAGNSLFFEHGQHATSICGTIGAAVAAGMLHGLDAASLTDTIGVAASMSSGVIEANRTGGTVKRVHCGWAAHAGVTAAEMVEGGITGPPTALEGRFGFFQAFLHTEGDLTVFDDLGTRWEVPDIFFKPYPANHFTHTGIDAAAQLRRDGVSPEQVQTIHLGVADPTVRTIGQPLEVKQAPPTGYAAQFSGPYAVVAGLLGGGGLEVGLDDFTDELATDAVRRELMSRITVGSDPRCDDIFPNQFPAVLTATLHNGQTIEIERLINRGSPQDPLSDEELATKFSDNAGRVLDLDTTQHLIDEAARLDRAASLDSLLKPLQFSS